MHPYLKHLLNDIREAHRIPKEGSDSNESQDIEDSFREIENWLDGTNEESVSYYTGLKKEDFPPSDQLTEPEMESVLHAFDKMLISWNVMIDFPSKMPVGDRYNFLLNTVLDDQITIVNYGTIHLDYCTGNPEGCAWGSYCGCLDFE